MYNSNNISERIKKIAKFRAVSLKETLDGVGLGFNTMSNMKKSIPKADNLARIADYLDCSVDYLLGRTENPQAHKGVSAVLNEIAAKLSNLNDVASEKVLEYIDDLAESGKYNNVTAENE